MNTQEYPYKNLAELVEALKADGVSPNEYIKYAGNYLETKARDFKVPMHGAFELTPLCNLDCRMCFIHLDDSRFGRDRLLPVQTWKDLIKAARELGMLKASLTGGECLSYPGFKEIYAYAAQLGVRTSVLTNAVLIDDEHVELFKKLTPRSIQVSLYGSSNDGYERVTGKRVFDIVIDNLERLRGAGLPVKVSITPSPFMLDDIFAILDIVHRLQVPYGINVHLMQPRADTGRTVENLSADDYIRIYKYDKALSGNSNIVYDEVDPDDLPKENEADGTPRRGLKCGAGRSSFVIHPDGTMSPCIGLDEVRTEPLRTGFREAWRALNGLAESFLIPRECGECVYRKNCLVCPAMHKTRATGHRDDAICQRTKKLVAAGLIPIPK